jgi:hypothetical protein
MLYFSQTKCNKTFHLWQQGILKIIKLQFNEVADGIYHIIFAEWIYRIFIKGVKSFNLEIVNYIIKPASEY